MCGFISILGPDGSDAIHDALAGLLAIQHRGQDAAGAVTFKDKFHAKKGLGLVREVFETKHFSRLRGLDLNNQPATGGHDGHGLCVFNALRLPNGNTLIGGGNNNRVLEVTPDKKVVWSIERDELKRPDGRPIHLCWVTSLQVLPNGNIIFGNTHAGPEHPQMIEVTRDKKVVWMLDDWGAFGNDLCTGWCLDLPEGTLR